MIRLDEIISLPFRIDLPVEVVNKLHRGEQRGRVRLDNHLSGSNEDLDWLNENLQIQELGQSHPQQGLPCPGPGSTGS